MAIQNVAIVLALLSAAQSEPCYRPPSFKVVVLNGASEYSAAAAFDVDQDGVVEILSGAYLYQAPHWRMRPIRDVERIGDRYDDYSNLPLDADGDGDLDLVSVNYRSGAIYVWLNPGATRRRWPRIVLDRPGRSETGLLVDIDGDGQPDILPNGVDYAAWYQRFELRASAGVVSVCALRRELPDALRGHGIGAGDVDGDGLVDIVGSRGWARQLRGLGATVRWQWHPEFALHRDASIPILVVDVDGDGDSDLVWGRGHDVGLYWMEQERTDQGRRWLLHCIDHTVSQVHALLWADLNRDGRPELVAGKRYLGHGGRDPGEYDPLFVRSYQFCSDRRTWHAATIAWDRAGWDLNPVVKDVDGDGDLDLVGPTRSGLYLLENLTADGADYIDPMPGVDAAPVYTERADLLRFVPQERLVVRVRRDNLFDWGRRRHHILQNMQKVMGPLPGPDRRVPLEVTVVERADTEAYERIKLFYTAEPGDRVPAYLLVPHGLRQPAPAVLVLHQTNPFGKDELVGLAGRPNRRYADELARAGFVCLVPDYPSFGEYRYNFSEHPEYASGSMKAIWNNIRAVDLLQSLPAVDRDRIAAFGHSLGGHNALFTAAFDLRIRAVVTSCGFTAFARYYGGDLRGWTSDRYMPRIRDLYGLDPQRVPFDFHDVLAAIAPRPLFVNAPLRDHNFDNRGVREVVDAVRAVYELFRRRENLLVVYPDSGHDFPAPYRERAYAWLKRVLR